MTPIGEVRRRWLEAFGWDQIIVLNARLCERTGSFHGPTSDGHEPCRNIWERRCQTEMSLREVIDLLLQSHRLAPFCFNNGNTFAAVARDLILDLGLGPEDAAFVRSAVGHYVAGVLPVEDLRTVLHEITVA